MVTGSRAPSDLEKAASIIEERADQLALGIALEGGKPLVDARVGIGSCR